MAKTDDGAKSIKTKAKGDRTSVSIYVSQPKDAQKHKSRKEPKRRNMACTSSQMCIPIQPLQQEDDLFGPIECT